MSWDDPRPAGRAAAEATRRSVHGDEAKHRTDEASQVRSDPRTLPKPRPRWLVPAVVGAVVVVVVGGVSAALVSGGGSDAPGSDSDPGSSSTPGTGSDPGDGALAGLSIPEVNPCPFVPTDQAPGLLGTGVVETAQHDPGESMAGGVPVVNYLCAISGEQDKQTSASGGITWRARILQVEVVVTADDTAAYADQLFYDCTVSGRAGDFDTGFTCANALGDSGLTHSHIGVGGTFGGTTLVCSVLIPTEEVGGQEAGLESLCADVAVAMAG